MTVGYRIADGTDLDAVFKARTSSPAANVLYRDSAGNDLSARYEPRGTTTARANTNYRNSAGTDLAQIFMDINAVAFTSNTLTAGTNGGNLRGLQTAAWGSGSVFGSISPAQNGGMNIDQIATDQTLNNVFLSLGKSPTPPNNDSTFSKIELVGIFSDSGSSQTKTLLRTDASWTDYASFGYAGALFTWGPTWKLINGNVYTVRFYR